MRILIYFYIIVLPLLCLPFVDMKGQESDLNSYMKSVEGNSLLYRGKIEKHYSFKYKGTYFAYQEEYVEGKVYYNQKLYTGVLLNLNSFTDELSVRLSEGHLPVLLEKNLVDYFSLGERNFVNVRDGKKFGVDSGFYEVLTEGEERLLKRIRKEYKENLVASGQDSKIEKVFDAMIDHYIVKGDKWVKVTGKGTFVKWCPERKKEINAIFRDAGRAERNEKDRLYKRMMEATR
ncbi:MAG: hypothetical protein IKW65_04690 [Bacteroidales bacterium]|nr:hypothetical protein [Bacteroidales bacterium]